MRAVFWFCLLLIGAGIYVRTSDPALWDKCVTALSTQSSPPPAPVAPVAPAQPPPYVDTFVPPKPLPAQPSWTWTVNGQEYHNVVVTKVEADKVYILHEDGAASLNQADLPPNVQKLCNYDPQLAAAAAQYRASERVRIDAEQRQKLIAVTQHNAEVKAAQEAIDFHKAQRAQKIEFLTARINKAQEAIAAARKQYLDIEVEMYERSPTPSRIAELISIMAKDHDVFDPDGVIQKQLAEDQKNLAQLQLTPDTP